MNMIKLKKLKSKRILFPTKAPGFNKYVSIEINGHCDGQNNNCCLGPLLFLLFLIPQGRHSQKWQYHVLDENALNE